MSERTLSPAAAKEFYDRFGSKQDAQAWYEDAAITALIRASRFSAAASVLEFGCGTGRLAEALLEGHLPETAVYRGLDISETMVRLSRERLSRFGGRAAVVLHATAEVPRLTVDGVDRFLSTYVLDLLPAARIKEVLSWASRVLRPGGLICLAGITRGTGLVSGAVMGTWNAVFKIRPATVGGCRPVVLADDLAPDVWAIEHHEVVVRWGIASEVVVARRRASTPP